jgi:hypothetical protein
MVFTVLALSVHGAHHCPVSTRIVSEQVLKPGRRTLRLKLLVCVCTGYGNR